MRRSNILFLVLIVGLVVNAILTHNNTAYLIYLIAFIIFKYVDIACEKKIPFWKPIRKFMYKYDYKPHITKVARRNSSFMTFPFLSAIEFDNKPFIELGFNKGTEVVLDRIKEDMRDSLFTVIQQLESLNNMTEEEKKQYFIQKAKDAEIKENENDLDKHQPDWRKIINN